MLIKVKPFKWTTFDLLRRWIGALRKKTYSCDTKAGMERAIQDRQVRARQRLLTLLSQYPTPNRTVVDSGYVVDPDMKRRD